MTTSFDIKEPGTHVTNYVRSYKIVESNALYIMALNEKSDDIQDRIITGLKKDTPVRLDVNADVFRKGDESTRFVGDLVSRIPLLKRIAFHFGNANQEFVNQLTRIIQSVTTLETLIWQFTIRSETDVSKLAEAIASHPNLQKIYIERPETIRYAVPDIFMDAFSKMNSLRNFILWNAITPSTLINKVLSFSKFLTSFYWRIDSRYPFFEIDVILPGLSSITTLESFTLAGKNFSTSELVKLIQALLGNKNLKILTLTSCSIDGPYDFPLVTQEIAKLSTLESLSFEEMGISNTGSIGIPHMLKQLTNLRKLDISDNGMFGSHLVDIAKSLAHNPVIEELQIHACLEPEDLQGMIEYLKFCPNLTIFDDISEDSLETEYDNDGWSEEWSLKWEIDALLTRNRCNIYMKTVTLFKLASVFLNPWSVVHQCTQIEEIDTPDPKRPRIK